MSRVMVAMSGGVDSSVAAALLVEQGHDVVGVTLKLWGGESDSGCCSVADTEDARFVANQLDIDHLVFNFGDSFNEHVVDPFVQAHSTGVTPNPCIECNRHIKFAKLISRADDLGIEMIATGHHARIESSPGEHGPESLHIARGADAAKDQSYVLHMLGQKELRRLKFPVGEMQKNEVREVAAKIGLDTAAKPDSQDVCFIHSVGGRKKFLGDRIDLRPAKVVDVDRNQVGSVQAVELVTLGQRRGLDLGGDTQRRYVVDIEQPKTQADAPVVVVGEREHLMAKSQNLDSFVWSDNVVSGAVQAQCSAHGKTRTGNLSESAITWTDPQPKVAVGQSVVFYVGDKVVGGALAA